VLVKNGCTHDVDLDSGRVLAPRERADVDRSARHELLIADGLLVPVSEDDDAPPAPTADPLSAPLADSTEAGADTADTADPEGLPWAAYDADAPTVLSLASAEAAAAAGADPETSALAPTDPAASSAPQES